MLHHVLGGRSAGTGSNRRRTYRKHARARAHGASRTHACAHARTVRHARTHTDRDRQTDRQTDTDTHRETKHKRTAQTHTNTHTDSHPGADGYGTVRSRPQTRDTLPKALTHAGAVRGTRHAPLNSCQDRIASACMMAKDARACLHHAASGHNTNDDPLTTSPLHLSLLPRSLFTPPSALVEGSGSAGAGGRAPASTPSTRRTVHAVRSLHGRAQAARRSERPCRRRRLATGQGHGRLATGQGQGRLAGRGRKGSPPVGQGSPPVGQGSPPVGQGQGRLPVVQGSPPVGQDNPRLGGRAPSLALAHGPPPPGPPGAVDLARRRAVPRVSARDCRLRQRCRVAPAWSDSEPINFNANSDNSG